MLKKSAISNINGFTLIELLIVVAIIGILASIAVPNFINAHIRAKVAKVVSEEKAVRDAYNMYFMDRNAWPPHLDSNDAQHRFVTTPISYLSTSIFCPFLFSEAGKKIPQWEYFRGQYHCEPGFFWHDKEWPGLSNNQPEYWSRQKNMAYFIISIGPDIDFDQPQGCPTCSAAIYNPSNGVRSSGDILEPIYGGFKYAFPYSRANGGG